MAGGGDFGADRPVAVTVVVQAARRLFAAAVAGADHPRSRRRPNFHFDQHSDCAGRQAS